MELLKKAIEDESKNGLLGARLELRYRVGIALLLLAIGVILFVFGGIYTYTDVDVVGTYFLYPFWNPPTPHSGNLSADYSLNYTGVVLLIASAVFYLVGKTKMGRSRQQPL